MKSPIYLEEKLSSIYRLLSNNEVSLALKASYDLLMYSTFEIQKKKIVNLDDLPITGLLDNIFNNLHENNIIDLHDFFIDLVHYTIFKKSYIRKYGIDSRKNAKLLCLQILNVIEFMDKDNSFDNSDTLSLKLYSGSIFADLDLNDIDNFSDVESTQLATIYSMYYSLKIQYYQLTKNDIWEMEISDFRFIEDAELETLMLIKQYIDEPENVDKSYIENVFKYASMFDFQDFFTAKIMVNQNIEYVIEHLENFRESNETIDKKIYTDAEKREATFHSVLYNALAMRIEEDEYILSEIPLGNKRFDLYWYKESIKLSSIIELKVNDLSNIDKDILQVEGYLNKKSSKIYLKKPEFGILVVLNSGTKKHDYVENKLKDKNIRYELVKDYFYIINLSMPIVVFIINDSNPLYVLQV